MSGTTPAPVDPSWAYNEALNNNPHLQNSPGLAADVLRSSNPTLSAPVLSHAATINGVQQAAQDYAAENPVQNHWWDSVAHNLGTNLEALGKPLKEVQRDYKFIHSLYARHGIFVGMLGTIAVAGGAVAGTALGGTVGTVIGADLAAAGLRKIVGNLDQYKDSYADSENENYKVSAGRDFANMLGAHGQTDSGWGKAVSGLVDATFDVYTDPLMKLGVLSKATKSGQFVKESGRFIPILARSAGAQEFFARNSLRIYNLDHIDELYQGGLRGNRTLAGTIVGASRQYHRALNDLAKMSSGDVIAKYPELQAFAYDLGRANTAEDVHKIFTVTKTVEDLMAKYSITGTPYVPSRSFGRAVLSKLSDKVRQPGWDKLSDSAFEFRNAANFIIPRFTANGAGAKQFIAPVALQAIPFVLTGGLSKEARQKLAEASASALAKKVRTFSGYQPYVIDSKMRDLSTKAFKPDDPAALQGIYRVMRFSLGDRAARAVVGAYADAPDLATKRSIYLSGLHEMFKAAGLPNDSHLVSDLLDHIGMKGEGTIASQTYGHGLQLGDDVSIVRSLDGSNPAGLHTHQAGTWAYPDFRQVKLAMRSMGNVGKVYGNVDEFTGRNYTDSIFKPLALLTTGFGLRIAASELIPTMIRFGSIDTVMAKISGAAAKMNYKLAAGEDQHIAANALLALSGGSNTGEFLRDAAANVSGKTLRKTTAKVLTKIADEEDFDLAARIAIATNGHMATGATLSGHGTENDFAERQRQLFDLLGQRTKKAMVESPDGKYGRYTVHNDHFDLHWVTNLQKASQNISQQSIAADVLTELKYGATQDEAWGIALLKEEARIRGVKYNPSKPNSMGDFLHPKNDTYAHEREVLSRYNDQDPKEFAFHRVDDMRNTLTGSDGTFHGNLAEMIANKNKPQLVDVVGLDSAAKPKSVIGAEMEAYVGNNLMQRIIQSGFKKVIDPIVGNLSRQPLFFHHVKQAMPLYQSMVDKGLLSEETALRLAMTQATHAMLPQIHNVALRTQFSILTRNFLPFYFAQEQATKRFIKLQTENPQAFREYQLIEHALNDPGFIHTDDQGNRYVVLPFVGEIGAGVISGAAALGLPVVGGLPVTVQGSMESLKTVLPEATMPGVSPMVALAANSLAALHPQFAREIKSIIGDRAFGQGLIDELIPSAPLRNAFKAMMRNEGDTAYHNAMLSAIAAASYHASPENPLPDPNNEYEQQAFIDRIKNNASSILMIKAVLSAFSPLSPQVSQEDLGLRDEFFKLVKEKGDYPTALHEFLGKHGNGAISYTVARTEGTIPGANMPYTNEVANWLQDNESLLKSDRAAGAAFLVPQSTSGGGDKQAIYDEILKLHLRTKRSPTDFLDAIYTATGNNQYFPDKKMHDDAIKSFGNNKELIDAENANWSKYVADFGRANPIWQNDFQSPERRNLASRAVNDLQYLFSNNLAPNTEQSRLVSELLNDYNKHQAAKDALRSVSSNFTLTQENDNWQAYLDQLVIDKPQLTTVINGVFRRLD